LVDTVAAVAASAEPRTVGLAAFEEQTVGLAAFEEVAVETNDQATLFLYLLLDRLEDCDIRQVKAFGV